jgi:hypothetical protein
MSFEITNDSRSERFRDLVAKAFIEILGQELQYGPWNVVLRSEREILSVVMTGPDDSREEWAFTLDRSGARAPAKLSHELWQRFKAARGRRKRL